MYLPIISSQYFSVFKILIHGLLTFLDVYKFREASRNKSIVAFHFVANNFLLLLKEVFSQLWTFPYPFVLCIMLRIYNEVWIF